MAKYFIITIDTEGDNMWRRHYSRNSVNNRITITNGKYLLRFQMLCEKYGLIPTYLVDYEMTFSNPLKNMVIEHNKKLEIGMHMHAWSCPPYYELDRAGGENPYITEYPKDIIYEKVKFLTERLKDVYGNDLKSSRSGRWAINEDYIDAIWDSGYIADCSVTPGIDWSGGAGQSKNSFGNDYTCANPGVSCLRMEAVSNRKLWEIPVTIKFCEQKHLWLRPNGKNLDEMKNIIENTHESGYVEFMLHSSELMPFGSPNFVTEYQIEKLYQDMEALFIYAGNNIGYKGIGLGDFAEHLGSVCYE